MFSAETISAKMLDDYIGRSDVLLIDLRDREAYQRAHIRTAWNIPFGELEEKEEFPKEKILIFYCDRGGASMAAAREMEKKGFQTMTVIGGFDAYRGRNLVISGKA
ncbi:MAG TPA: rhodanese-like domain-containing protein [Candidatus Blautia faecipullorum]|uniref:Rhodanese-like domain-containing protein n=1 Tax=Candidatus Blautia faecigallinarum TaxID=2838488 RepID=A0A9D2DR02_9FIRM|nr:rhodanese-like domain-containing protein [Candidatus Blautia faecipullorum]HIZ21756.1 rhodanese-like domain-containing protein [Candidatus Blautia faecigallinarum]